MMIMMTMINGRMQVITYIKEVDIWGYFTFLVAALKLIKFGGLE